jgi:hypothetical protein
MAIDRCGNCDVMFNRDHNTECPMCNETLSEYLVRQFRESGDDRVDHGELASNAVRLGTVGRGLFRRGHVGGETKG